MTSPLLPKCAQRLITGLSVERKDSYMKKYSLEFAVGIFVFLGLLCVAYLTVRLGKMDMFSAKNYSVVAKFGSVSGLKSGAEVMISGVSVGKVSSIELAPDYRATVRMNIREGIELSEDTGASIKTSGLIGDKYIALSPGGSPDILSPNDEISLTQSAIDIESLISNYVFGDVK